MIKKKTKNGVDVAISNVFLPPHEARIGNSASMDSDAGPNFSFFKPTVIELKGEKKALGGGG